MLVGEALKAKHQNDEQQTWEHGPDPGKAARKFGISRTDVIERERGLEILVSRSIGAMPFLWLAIDDEPGLTSLRGFVERNSIALLSNYEREPVDPPSQSWLGSFSAREAVHRSGLWNNNHVADRIDRGFLDTMQVLVSDVSRG